jgi:hypothetical protein
MYLITCDFKFFKTLLAKFSGDPWSWVTWVMVQSENKDMYIPLSALDWSELSVLFTTLRRFIA